MSYGYVHRRHGTSPGVEEPPPADQVQCNLAALAALPLASGEPESSEGWRHFRWGPSVPCERVVIPPGFTDSSTQLDVVIAGLLPQASALLLLQIESEQGAQLTVGASWGDGQIIGDPQVYEVPAGGRREVVVRFDDYGQRFTVFDPATEAPCVLHGGEIRLDIGNGWGTLSDALPAQVLSAHGAAFPSGNGQAYGCRWRTLDARRPGSFDDIPLMIPGVHYLPSEGSIQFGPRQSGTVEGLEVPLLYPVADDIDLSGGLQVDVTGARILNFELFGFDNALQQDTPQARYFSMETVFQGDMEVSGTQNDPFIRRAFVLWGTSSNGSRLGKPNVYRGLLDSTPNSFRYHNQIVVQHNRPRANLAELGNKMALLVVHRLPVDKPLPVYYAYGYSPETSPQEMESEPRWTSLPDGNGEHSFAVKFGLVDGDVTVLQMTSDITLIDDSENLE